MLIDTGEMIRQRLPASAWAFRLGDRVARLVVFKVFDFRFDRGQIGILSFFEDIALQRRQAFVLAAKTNPLVIGEFVG